MDNVDGIANHKINPSSGATCVADLATSSNAVEPCVACLLAIAIIISKATINRGANHKTNPFTGASSNAIPASNVRTCAKTRPVADTGATHKNLSGATHKNLSGATHKNLSGATHRNLSGATHRNLFGATLAIAAGTDANAASASHIEASANNRRINDYVFYAWIPARRIPRVVTQRATVTRAAKRCATGNTFVAYSGTVSKVIPASEIDSGSESAAQIVYA